MMETKEKSILDYETVAWTEDGTAIRIIDQTLLPGETRLIDLTTAQEIWNAIYLLQVRGAPAIGVTAALGIALLAGRVRFESDTPAERERNLADLRRQFLADKEYLAGARPTAVNLTWALNRMEAVFEQCAADASMTMRDIQHRLREEADAIRQEDIDVCRRIGEFGLTLVQPGDGILTHCNAGQLATVRYGTATAPIYLAHEKGYGLHVFCDETRPLLQGARLTAYELSSAGIDVTLLCDNMCSSIMRTGRIQAVFVGCDRVAANGDTANKIGTSVVAAVARSYGIPFYVCAPVSTIDLGTPDGSGIVIEQRDPDEVTTMWYEKRMAPENINVYNPAFDVTDHSLITAIVTENGIAKAPYEESLRQMVEKSRKG